MRDGGGPALIECKTYRYRGHSEHDPALYRDKEELIEWQSRDPIPQLRVLPRKEGPRLQAHPRSRSTSGCSTMVQAAVDFAEQSPLPEASKRRLKISTRRTGTTRL